MKPSVARILLGLLLSGWLVACGGGGNNPPPTPLSITTTSLPGGQKSTAYNTSLAAMGGTPPYTWTLKSGTLPAGLSLSSSGTISGTPTTPGSSSFAVQVADSATTPQSTSGNLSIAINGGALLITTTTAATGTVGTPYNFQLEATGGVPPYNWAVATGSTLPAGLSLSTAGVVSGTPTASGTFNPSISVTDDASNTTSQQVNFSINPAGKPLPDGDYAFEFSGTTNGNPLAINGAFEVAKGSIAIGFYNENELDQAPQANQTITGGSVSIGTNGLGQLELNLQSGNVTFALALPASATTQTNDTDIRIIEFDDSTGSGQRGSGVLKGSNPNGSLSAIKGGYAFGLSGYDTHSQPTAVAGSFQADGLGNITSGSVDINDNGTLTNYNAVTGTYTADSLGGLITLKFGGGTLTYNYYQVSPTELLAISGDMSSSTVPLVSGVALQQSGSFTNGSFNTINVLETAGRALENPASYIPDITLGVLSSDGAGNVVANYDEFKGSLLATQTYTGTYAVDATTGRTPMTWNGGVKLILYLVGNARAFVLGTDSSTSSGITEVQSGLSPLTPLSNRIALLKGNYLGGTVPWPELNAVSLAVADGAGNIRFTSNTSGSSGLKSNVMATGTYTVEPTGRTVVTVSGDATPRILYVVSASKAVLLSGDTGGYLLSMEQ